MGSSETESTFELLRRSIDGDRGAAERFCERLRPRLRRWAAGRLPPWARDSVDTDDLVQGALLRTLLMPRRIELRPNFQAYIHQAIRNSIRDHVQKAIQRRRAAAELMRDRRDALSPLEALLGSEKLERFEAALSRLPPSDREAIVCRVELGMSHREIADAMGKPTPDAARMAVARAFLRLAREIHREP